MRQEPTLVERLRRYSLRSGYAWYCHRAADRIEQLERENAELRKDADRYRWLFTGPSVYARFLEAYHIWDGSDGKTGFDAAIDEAMKS